MAWAALIAAGLCEMVGVAMISQWYKDRRILSLLGMLGGFAASFVLLAVALEQLPMGTAYAIWTGIGAAGGALVGMIAYGESKDWRRILCIALVLGSVIGLKWIG